MTAGLYLPSDAGAVTDSVYDEWGLNPKLDARLCNFLILMALVLVDDALAIAGRLSPPRARWVNEAICWATSGPPAPTTRSPAPG